MNKFYLMYPSGSVDDYIFQDATNLIHIDAKSKPTKNPISKIFKKINLSRKLNAVLPLPFKAKWYDFKGLGKDKNTQYYCIALASSFLHVDIKMIRRMFKKDNMHLSIMLLDPYDSNTPVPKMTRKVLKMIKFEHVYCYDKKESEIHGYEYMGETMFSNSMFEDIKPTNEYDLYFLGRFKSGRGNNIFDIAKRMNEHGVNFRCKIQKTSYGMKEANLSKVECEDIIEYFDKFIVYKDVLRETAKTNCILELIQDTESDISLRYFEAVVFNKKLLTNNKNILKMKYYNPKYMKLFSSFDDIDYEWVKKIEKVDYGYKGDFSCKTFFDNEIRKIEK